jgi:general secretion pathway protein G
MKSQSGFTLVEILIVVVILGILAAIVIPQFTEASTEAKTSSLVTDLQSVRSQIQLYKIQHLDQLPGTQVAAVNFVSSMTSYTLQDGTLAAPQEPGDGVYGPYLNQIPKNQFIAVAANQALVTEDVTTPAAADNSTGWFFNTVTGEFKANDTYSADHWDL